MPHIERITMTASRAAAVLLEPELKAHEAMLQELGDTPVTVELGPDAIRICLLDGQCIVKILRTESLS